MIDFGKGGVVRGEFAEVGDVAGRAVRIRDRHLDRLCLILFKKQLVRADRDAGRLRFAGDAARGSLGDPLAEDFVKLGVFLKTLFALVRDRIGRLEEEEGMVGRGGENTAPPRIIDDLAIVRIGIEGKDRKLESVLPVRLRVATPEHAAGPGHDGENVVLKRDGGGRRGLERGAA